jgi:hypothetical protein
MKKILIAVTLCLITFISTYLYLSNPATVVVEENGNISGLSNRIRAFLQGQKFWQNQLSVLDEETRFLQAAPGQWKFSGHVSPDVSGREFIDFLTGFYCQEPKQWKLRAREPGEPGDARRRWWKHFAHSSQTLAFEKDHPDFNASRLAELIRGASADRAGCWFSKLYNEHPAWQKEFWEYSQGPLTQKDFGPPPGPLAQEKAKKLLSAIKQITVKHPNAPVLSDIAFDFMETEALIRHQKKWQHRIDELKAIRTIIQKNMTQ